MSANTYRTLNDYRVSTESVYENGSHSKLGAGALVAAIFLGVGAYFFYPMYQRSENRTPASGDMNYQAPAAPVSAPTDTIDSAATPDAPNAVVPAPAMPTTDTNSTRAPAQESEMNRTATDNKSNAVPAQRAKPSTKSPAKSTNEATPTAPNAATATPDLTQSAPVGSSQPTKPATIEHTTSTAQESMATKSEAPAAVAPDAAIAPSAGG